jgi:hypothetical protein
VSASTADFQGKQEMAMRSVRDRMLQVVLILLLAVAPAAADLAVVPDDFATIQQAVQAVQGTADALVRIDSNATFAETVTATASVATASTALRAAAPGTLRRAGGSTAPVSASRDAVAGQSVQPFRMRRGAS